MKTIITAIAASLFTAGVSAADIYHGLAEGNSDLSPWAAEAHDFTGVQPSVGDSFDRYHGFADGNPDLFQPLGRMPREIGHTSEDDQPIYVGPGLTL